MAKLLARATVAVVWLLAAAVAQAQSLQLWGNVTFDWVKSRVSPMGSTSKLRPAWSNGKGGSLQMVRIKQARSERKGSTGLQAKGHK